MKDINAGLATNECMYFQFEKDRCCLRYKQITEFMNNAISIISSLLGKCVHRSPFKSIAVMCVGIFNPCTLATEDIKVLQLKIEMIPVRV